MFVRSSAVNRVLSVLFVLSVGACGNFGGCSACNSVAPLPAGGLPVDQTVEGGAQIRVTPQGFDKLTSLLPGAINQALGNGICVPGGSAGLSIAGFDVASAHYCESNSGATCNPGCKINTSLNSLSTQVVGQNLRVNVSAQLHTTIHLDFYAVGINVDSCDMTLDSNDLNGSFDVAFGIKPADGSLDIHLANINSFSLDLTWGNCGIISDIGSLITNLLDAIPDSIKSLLTPLIDPLIQSFLPNPLGLEGMMNVGQLLSGISPGTQAEMEARVVPGGYVDLNNNGMSLGVIMGLNSDRDPSTRDNGLASEPALCVPPLPAPQFGAPPFSLPLTSRNTFALSPADEFNGSPDPTADLAMGVSQTSLDQLGHHAVTSGALCLGVGTSYIQQLNVGTLGLLVPSLAQLAGDQASNAPLLLVTRPQRALTFTIGDNTTTSPALTVGISHMEVDFYAFLYERYVRAFTMDLSMNVGVNLAFEQQPGMPVTIQPTLLGIDSNSVQVTVLNSQFVKETPAHLEAVLPSVFNLVTPLLGNIPPITVPSFAGFSLNDLSIQKVTTSQDKFLALYATLGAGAMARQLAAHDPFAARAVEKLDAAIAPAQPASTGRATLRSVVTPPVEAVRGALLGQPGGALPSITFDVDRYDSRGRELEWAWNFNGGMWHAYSSASPLVISDPAFAWQGKYTIGLKSRVKGDYRTVSNVTETPVVIDSVGPNILTDKAAWDGDTYTVPVWDIVSGTNVQVAFGRPGEDAPKTAWQPSADATLDRAQLQQLAVDDQVAVFAKDEQGNQTIALVLPFHGTGSGAGCACNTGSGPGAGGVLLFALVGGFMLGGSRKRRARSRRLLRSRALRTAGAWLGATLLSSLVPGCSCGSHPGQACEMGSDCPVCPQGQLPFCIDGACVCSDDIPPGRIGPYSDVAVGPDGSAWVSAYAESFGDLVVAQSTGGRIPVDAWQWVDGVPSGPVTVPGSKIRGGISDPGEDVGMYTSIAVAQDGTVSVSYFDHGAQGAPAASLKFAQLVNGTWQTHVVDAGNGGIDNAGDSQVGMYTSLTLRSDDGRPGIAYLAHVHDAMGTHAEVRYAAAQTPHPTSSSDWQTWVVDTAAIPPADPNNPDVYPLPGGLGLFIDSARDPRNQAPVVVYYDRAMGELKEARFDTTTGQFATPVVLAGMGDVDAGWSPTVQVDDQGVAHVAYVNATSDDFDYITDAPGATTETIDDGYRLVGQTVDGLPKPTFDFVGDDAGLVLTPSGPMAVYQDATTQELLLASRAQNGMWSHVSVAGATDPWPGAYGFFASATLAPNEVVMSSWVIDQPNNDNWVEVFTHQLQVQ